MLARLLGLARIRDGLFIMACFWCSGHIFQSHHASLPCPAQNSSLSRFSIPNLGATVDFLKKIVYHQALSLPETRIDPLKAHPAFWSGDCRIPHPCCQHSFLCSFPMNEGGFVPVDAGVQSICCRNLQARAMGSATGNESLTSSTQWTRTSEDVPKTDQKPWIRPQASRN